MNTERLEKSAEEKAAEFLAQKTHDEAVAFQQFVQEHSGSPAVRRFIAGDKTAVFAATVANQKQFAAYCETHNVNLSDARELAAAFAAGVTSGELHEYSQPKEYERHTDLGESRFVAQAKKLPDFPTIPPPFTRAAFLKMPIGLQKKAVRKFGSAAIDALLKSS